MFPLIAIDPGRNVGFALALGGRLTAVGTTRDPDTLPGALIAVVEQPRVYPTVNKWKGDPQDLVRLATLAGEIGARYPVVWYVEPRTWMGGSPPDHVLRARTDAALGDLERDLVSARKLSAHAWDALGMLFFSLGRFRRDRPRRGP